MPLLGVSLIFLASPTQPSPFLFRRSFEALRLSMRDRANAWSPGWACVRSLGLLL